MAWNRSDGSKQLPTKKKFPILKISIAGAFSVALCIIGFFFYHSDSDEKSKIVKISSPLKEVKPASKHIIKEVPERTKWRPKTKPNKTARLTPPARTTKDIFEHVSLPSNCLLKASIFRHQSDGMIAGILTAVPGDHFLCDDWDNGFDEEFRNSLKDEILIDDNDSEEDKTLKEAVIAARRMLAQYMDNGEKPSQIMREAQEEIEKVTEYRDQLNEELEALLDKKDVEEALAYCDEANKILQEYDAEPLSVSERQIKKLLRLREKESRK